MFMRAWLVPVLAATAAWSYEFPVPRRTDLTDPTLILAPYIKVNTLAAPGKGNRTRFAKSCRLLDNDEIGPLKQDPSCAGLFTALNDPSASLSLVCNDECFSRYMLAYNVLEEKVCLEQDEMTSFRFRTYVCQQDFAPSFDCDQKAASAMKSMLNSGVCTEYADGLLNGVGLHPCNGTCYNRWLAAYRGLYYDDNCFRYDLELPVRPENVSKTVLCASPSPSPSTIPPPPVPSSSSTTAPSRTPVESPSNSPTPSFTPAMSTSPTPSVSISTADPTCDILGLKLMGPLRSTLCRAFLGDGIQDESHSKELCGAPCFQDYLKAYETMHEASCLVSTLDNSAYTAAEFQQKVCGYTSDLVPPSLIAGRNGSLTGKVEATLSITMTRVVMPSAFERLYAPILVKAIAIATEVAVTKVSVTSVSETKDKAASLGASAYTSQDEVDTAKQAIMRSRLVGQTNMAAQRRLDQICASGKHLSYDPFLLGKLVAIDTNETETDKYFKNPIKGAGPCDCTTQEEYQAAEKAVKWAREIWNFALLFPGDPYPFPGETHGMNSDTPGTPGETPGETPDTPDTPDTKWGDLPKFANEREKRKAQDYIMWAYYSAQVERERVETLKLKIEAGEDQIWDRQLLSTYGHPGEALSWTAIRSLFPPPEAWDEPAKYKLDNETKLQSHDVSPSEISAAKQGVLWAQQQVHLMKAGDVFPTPRLSLTGASVTNSIIKVGIQCLVPKAGVELVSEALYESTSGVNPALRNIFNRELTASSASLQALEVAMSGMAIPVLQPACDGSVGKANHMCRVASPAPRNASRVGETTGRGMCSTLEPSEACCAATFHVVSNGCDMGQEVCGETWSTYFDERCIKARGLTSNQRHTLTLERVTGATDLFGCIVAHNFTWCEAKDTCVQNYPGGQGYPCPYQRKICRGNCSEHGVCLGNNTCACHRGYAGRMCQVQCPGLCYGNGRCGRDGQCMCDEGWKGDKCQYKYWMEYPGELTYDCYPDTAAANVTWASWTTMCNGRGLCQNHRCRCNYGYAGPFCERQVFLECPNQCSDHGERCIVPDALLGTDSTFVQFWGLWGGLDGNYGAGGGTWVDGDRSCLCKPGYAGDDCSQWSPSSTVCPNACSGRGICGELGCQCHEGYKGAGCEYGEPCPANCSGHGLCSHGENPVCVCHRGFTGTSCQQAVPTSCPYQCSGHGKCNETSRACICKRGWEGVACEKMRGDPTCEECKHGTCHSNKVFNVTRGRKNKSVCWCDHGWTGARCDKPYLCAAVSFCSGRGICNAETASCDCLAGFSGQSCDRIPDLCPNHCSGNGRCKARVSYDQTTMQLSITGTCDCAPGWTGPACNRSLCRTPPGGVCNMRGVCEQAAVRTKFECTCDDGWLGQGCEEREEECPGTGSPTCSGHGSCRDGTCVCDDDWAGTDCSLQTTESRIRMNMAQAGSCPHACSDNGACIDGVCHCHDGWMGVACETFAEGDDGS